MKSKNAIVEYIKQQKFDYSKPIRIEDISSIMNYFGFDFYIEGLTTNCGDGEMTLYLDYYDSNANAVICIDEMEYSYVFLNEYELYGFIVELEERVRMYREKFLIFKK